MNTRRRATGSVRNAVAGRKRRAPEPAGGESSLPTLVTYTDAMPPQNQFPRRVISPTRSGPCCFTDMAALGKPRRNDRYEYEYRRCQTCGFTLRVIVRYLPDKARMTDLRKVFATTLTRNMPPA